MDDDLFARMNYEVAANLARQFAVELAQEIQRLGVVTPKVEELAEKVLEANGIAERLRRQMVIQVAG